MTNPGWNISRPRPAKPFISRIVLGIVGAALLLGWLSVVAPAEEHGTNSFYMDMTLRSSSIVATLGPAATISSDGVVKINWERVEQIVAAPKGHDAKTLAFLRALIAVRDGTYERQE